MENASNYVNIGKVAYWPFFKKKKERVLYVMISKDKVQKYGNQTYDVRYTENPDGTGLNTDSIPESVKNQMAIYPEYQNTEYGDFLLGARKDKATLEKEHGQFENALSTFNGKIVLRHDSSYVIKDGVIRKGKPNTYSKDSDIGIYFWGSDKVGKDNSNVGTYTYYCLVDRESTLRLPNERGAPFSCASASKIPLCRAILGRRRDSREHFQRDTNLVYIRQTER